MEFFIAQIYFELVLKNKKYELNGIGGNQEIITGIISNYEDNESYPQLFNCSVLINKIDLFNLLNTVDAGVKFYWKSRESNDEVLCINSALTWNSFDNELNVEVFNEILNKIGSTDSRIYGGFRFSNSNKSDQWRNYGNYYFFLPKFEIKQSDNQTHLFYNCFINGYYEFEEQLKEDFSLFGNIQTYNDKKGSLGTRSDTPDKITWIENVKYIKDSIDSGSISKAVLSRESKFNVKDLKAETLIEKLKDMNQNTFVFMFSLGESSVMGASPELFYSRNGKELTIDALAGTRPRSEDSQQDLQYESELRNSEKELKEQGIVTKSIVKDLEPICNHIKFNKIPVVKKFAKVQHLYTEIKASLKDDIDDHRLLQTLHPTPAMGGLPRKTALDIIEKIEKHDRGFYSAPIGYISKNKTEFAVCIRSGLLHKDNLYLYSGAGIVKDSEPDSEWQELNNKLNNFLRVFENND